MASANASSSHGNVYIRGLPPTVDQARLLGIFSAFGDIDSVRISPTATDNRTGVSHAFVRFKEPDAASIAIDVMQGTLLDDVPVTIKLANADAGPKILSGQCASEWAYVRGLPSHLNIHELSDLFSLYGQVKELRHFPSTELSPCSGALVQYEDVEQSYAAIVALNGRVMPGGDQPLMIRYADSPAEKAEKAARKERLHGHGGFNGSTSAQNLLQEQLQQQLHLLVGNFNAAGGVSNLSLSGVTTSSNPAGAAMAGGTLFGRLGTGTATTSRPPLLSRNCSIYIKGLPEIADNLWLYENFTQYGGIISVRVLLDKVSRRCNGIGFVNYTDPEGARLAQAAADGVFVGEKQLQVVVQSHGTGGGAQSTARSITPVIHSTRSWGPAPSITSLGGPQTSFGGPQSLEVPPSLPYGRGFAGGPDCFSQD